MSQNTWIGKPQTLKELEHLEKVIPNDSSGGDHLCCGLTFIT
jgi:hypothetical protein